MSRLAVKNVVFSLVVPGVGAVLLPWWLLSDDWRLPSPVVWPALSVVVVGLGLYAGCVRTFAVVGRGTPGPWDPPRELVVSGPYRWVRNPIYLAAITVVLGEAWLFESVSLVEYAAGMAVFVHLFVISYEEPVLRRSFGAGYLEYKLRVNRWLRDDHRCPRRVEPSRSSTARAPLRRDCCHLGRARRSTRSGSRLGTPGFTSCCHLGRARRSACSGSEFLSEGDEGLR